MTEQEYCELSDLQLLRAVKPIIKSINGFYDENHEDKLIAITHAVAKMINDLEKKVSIDVEDD